MIFSPVASIVLASLFAGMAAIAIIQTLRTTGLRQSQAFLMTGLAIWTIAASLELAHLVLAVNIDANLPIILMFVGGLCFVYDFMHSRSNISRSKQYRSLISAINAPCFVISNHRILAWNDALTAATPCPDDLTGADPFEIWGDTFLNGLNYDELEAQLLETRNLSFGIKYTLPDESKILLELTVSTIGDEEDDFLVVINDNTETVRQQQQEKLNDLRLAHASDIANLGYWHFHIGEDTQTGKRPRDFSSLGLSRIYGLDAEEDVSSERLWSLVHPADVEEVRSIVDKAEKEGITPDQWSFRIIRPDGEMRHLVGQIGILRDENSVISQIIGVVQDITETIRSEDRLRHAQKMEAVGELTGGLSHDFNNLLHVILGNVELIQSPLEEDIESKVAIQRAAQRGSELTQRLLAFSRKQILDPRSIDINDCVAHMLPLLRRTLGESIQIDAFPASDLLKCKIDSGQLETSILNLAINAQHAMPQGGKLTIETKNIYLDQIYAARQEEVSAGSYVQVSICDTGSGMPDQILDRVFEPFFTTKEVGKGSGLGLSMVYGFIKQSGGHVSIYSELKEGTTVKLYLPISSSESHEVPDLVQSDNTRFTGKVLLVEDDAEVATLTRKFLESVGLQVVPARKASEAFKIIKEQKNFTLLLSDVVLPGGINGPQMAEQIKQKLPELKILFMSGYTENAIVNHGIIEEGVTLLHKPFRKTEMIEKLQQVFSQ